MENLEKSLSSLKGMNSGLRESFEKELLMLRSLDKQILAHVNPQGFVAYSLGNSDFLLSTIHNGSIVPEKVNIKQSSEERLLEEDILTGELYLPLFLEKGGTWMTSHVSRYFVDLNRSRSQAIASYDAKEKLGNFEHPDDDSLEKGFQLYDSFYNLASELAANKFHFAGHSMKDSPENGDFCLIYEENAQGMPLQENLAKQGLADVRINTPFVYENGHFRRFVDFVNKNSDNSVEFETNKDLYLDERLEKSAQFDATAQKILTAIRDTYF